MTDKSWKAVERRVARFFGCGRTPCSGGMSGHTRADVIHPRLFVEVKHRARTDVGSLYMRTRELARAEGKVPVIALKDKRVKCDLLVVDKADLLAVAWELRSSGKEEVKHAIGCRDAMGRAGKPRAGVGLPGRDVVPVQEECPAE